MNDLTSVMRAADCAANWHVHQRRKGSAQEPYINHLLEVARLVAQATNGTNMDATIAALLHDAIEDQGVTAETIAGEFGQHVADIVMEVTDDKSIPKAERKRKQVETASHKSRQAKLIKLADKTSNIRAVVNSPAPDWSVQRRLEYVEWAKEVIAGVRGTSPWLERQFDQATEYGRSCSITNDLDDDPNIRRHRIRTAPKQFSISIRSHIELQKTRPRLPQTPLLPASLIAFQ